MFLLDVITQKKKTTCIKTDCFLCRVNKERVEKNAQTSSTQEVHR